MLQLPEIFNNKASLNKFSKACTRLTMLERDQFTVKDDWVIEGAGPDSTNFYQFNASPEGLWVIFREYQVGCYTEGKREVFHFKRFLKPLMDTKNVLFKIWFSYYFKE